MNIFYLDMNPTLCAQYHTDKHVVKMILESAQLLCTAVNVVAGEQVTPYKSTHVNHPCAIWVRESYSNWLELYYLMLALEDERRYRFESKVRHKSVDALCSSGILVMAGILPHEYGTRPPLCMPDHCKVSADPVECYREYYRREKVALHKWTGRDKPEWL
jgi:hypothetical protein